MVTPDRLDAAARSRRLLEAPWRRFRRTGTRSALTAGLPGAPAVHELDVAPDLPDRDAERLRARIAELLARRDTASQRVEAASVAATYLSLSDTGRRRFLTMVGREFAAPRDTVDAAVRAVTDASGAAARRAAERDLRDALTPASARLLHLFTGLGSGVKFLVDLRADLLRLGTDDPGRADLDHELKAHLTTLFDVGLLELRRITWDAPASLLEKLIDYEAVHAIESWADLENRLDSDRRCFAFFHPSMPNEPIVFVEVALTRGIVGELPVLLDEEAPDLDVAHADTAIFYSISSCQPGLAGVNLGNALIKQVVERLATELPGVRTYATLSPVPAFADWCTTRLGDDDLTPGERALLPPGATAAEVGATLRDPDWPNDRTRALALRPLVLALAARLLTTTRDARVQDPVANFHLANGASVDRLNWMADPSPTGLARSAGVMATYRYEPEHLSARAEAYIADGAVAAGDAVRALLPD
ncbi:MAG TPA: malonyl-CoA decarboxylase family protein [Acidimicrobiia bacterium]|nr:malonyl-CoA decarboxylase family protein [Acidimicrobiia bacterium]